MVMMLGYIRVYRNYIKVYRGYIRVYRGYSRVYRGYISCPVPRNDVVRNGHRNAGPHVF